MHANVTAQERKWRIESDLDALVRAQEIRKDMKRFSAAKKLAKDKLKAMETATA